MNYDLTLFNEKVKNLESAFAEIQQPRSNFVLEKFVVKALDTPEQQYCQCVLELQIKYDNIRRAVLNRKKVEMDIAKLQEKIDDPYAQIDLELRKIDLEEMDRATLGAVREFKCLYEMWETYPKYTREQIDNAQETYWNKRLSRQANHDILAGGRVGVGNQEALMQIGVPLEELQKSAATGSLISLIDKEQIESVAGRYLEKGDTKVLLVVPTEKKAENGLPVLNDLEIPSGVQVKIVNIHDMKIDDAYTYAANMAVMDKADYLLCIEDDTYPPKNAISKLINLVRENDKSIVGAWYPKRSELNEGTPIIIKNGKRQALKADDKVHEVYTIPQGCTLIPSEVFINIRPPWFATTKNLTQDSFFSQLAREAGYKLLVDTSIRCKHKDRRTGKVYE
jgi:hypothetical protein